MYDPVEKKEALVITNYKKRDGWIMRRHMDFLFIYFRL